MVSMTNASTCSLPEKGDKVSLTTRAIALVLMTAMNAELVNSAATGVPTIRL
jgi:hypothetical protein